jgi:hypothetical protein
MSQVSFSKTIVELKGEPTALASRHSPLAIDKFVPAILH